MVGLLHEAPNQLEYHLRHIQGNFGKPCLDQEWCGRGTMVGPRVLIAVEFVKQEKLGQRQEDLDQMRNF